MVATEDMARTIAARQRARLVVARISRQQTGRTSRAQRGDGFPPHELNQVKYGGAVGLKRRQTTQFPVFWKKIHNNR